jgi:hypothetical protein
MNANKQHKIENDDGDDEVRAPIKQKIMRLIDDEPKPGMGSDTDSDSDINEKDDDIEKAIKLSLRDVYRDNYEKQRKIKVDAKYNDSIINNMQLNKADKEEHFKNLRVALLGDDTNIHYRDKILKKIILYINGICKSIELDSQMFYYVNAFIEGLNNNEKVFILTVMKAKNDVDYIEYCFAMQQSKADTINYDLIEIKKRKELFEPIFKKFKMLRGIDKETQDFENKIKSDIDMFINNQTNTITIEEEDYNKLISIVNSARLNKEDTTKLYAIIIKK